MEKQSKIDRTAPAREQMDLFLENLEWVKKRGRNAGALMFDEDYTDKYGLAASYLSWFSTAHHLRYQVITSAALKCLERDGLNISMLYASLCTVLTGANAYGTKFTTVGFDIEGTLRTVWGKNDNRFGPFEYVFDPTVWEFASGFRSNRGTAACFRAVFMTRKITREVWAQATDAGYADLLRNYRASDLPMFTWPVEHILAELVERMPRPTPGEG